MWFYIINQVITQMAVILNDDDMHVITAVYDRDGIIMSVTFSCLFGRSF